MRTARINKRKMYYALQTGKTEIPVYDSDGNIKTIVVDGETVNVLSGKYETEYSLPVEFFANIALSGGDIQAQEFGLDINAYDAIIVLNKDEIPITETSLIWFQSEPQYKDALQTTVEPKSADYRVVAIKPSLNTLKAVLSRITK